MSRREVVLPYMFDGFQSVDTFMVIETNHAFDCILGMLWLARYQPKINWLARSVKRRSDFDMSEGFTHLLVSPRDWPHVTVVDQLSTTQSMHRASDGPLCVACSAVVHDVHGRRSPRRRVENDIAVEQGLPHANEMTVEQGLLHVTKVTVEQGLPYDDSTGEVDHDHLRLEDVATSPKDAKSNIQLPVISWKHFLRHLKVSEIELICLITDADSVSPMVNAASASDDISARPKSTELKSAREEHFENAVIPAKLPAGRGVHHEIDLAPSTKYCVTRQWPLPRDQVKAIDDFFENRAGHVRERISPHSSQTFCVKKATGGWRIVHAFNKLNDATIPAQTPIPRKDMVLDSMSGSVIYSVIDLTDGSYQILIRECDAPLTAVSTPSGMLWEWLVMPQVALKETSSAVDVHLQHLRQVFRVMRDNKRYANLKKCIFCAPDIPVLGCYVSKNGVRADPEKVTSICSWLTPMSPTELPQWLGMTNYLHKYTKNYAKRREAFDAVKTSLASAPILMLPDDAKLFHFVYDTGDFLIGCALMQIDDDERKNPVHSRELFAMRYTLIKFRVYLLGEETFAVYTDHASQRTAMKSPHLLHRMARWLSFFAEYNFVVHYKPGKNNIRVRRPGYDPRNSLGHQQANDEDDEDACASCVAPELIPRAESANAYEYDTTYSKIMNYLRSPSDVKLAEMFRSQQSQIDRYSLDDNLLVYSIDKFDALRVVIPNDADLCLRIIHEFHDAPIGGHLGREKTFAALSRAFFWPHMYKWVRKWVRTCEICQRVKTVELDFVFVLPPDDHGRTGVLVFVDRFSKMVHFVPVSAVTAEESAVHLIDTVFRYHGMPVSIVSDRNPRFTSAFWSKVFEIVGTKLKMSTGAHLETDGQTERVNGIVEDVLQRYETIFQNWSSFLPLPEFAINNADNASMGVTSLFINNARHPRVPTLRAVGPPPHPRGSTL
ncbi:Retroelement, partial [Phytophthora megakarya]